MSTNPPGKKYKRWPDLEAEIQRVSRLPQSHWLAELPNLQSETLVFLARQTERAIQEVFGPLVQEISRRTIAMARRWISGLKNNDAEYVLLQVEFEILQLVLAETKSSQSEFLEYSFATAIEHRTINAVQKYKNSAMGKRDDFIPVSDVSDFEEFDEIERPIELLADKRPDQLATVLAIENETLQPELVQKACAAVEDPRHLEAVILHHVEGWPITSKDPNKWTLERYFKKKPREIKYWIKKALKAMKDAIGEK